MSVNLAILVGNVGQNPDIKVFDGGTKKATFSLATSEKYKDRNGEVHENTQWHNIVCWRATADVVERFVKKGTQVYIQGKITTRSWEDQNGQKRFATEIVADEAYFVDTKSEMPGQSAPQVYASSAAVSQQIGYMPNDYGRQSPMSAPAPAMEMMDDGELPF